MIKRRKKRMSAPPPSSPMITLYTHSLVKWAGKMCLPQQGVSSDRLLLLTRLTLFPGCVTGGGNVPQPREHLATSPPLEIDAVRFDDDGEKGVIRPWAFGAAVILWERRAVEGGKEGGGRAANCSSSRPPCPPLPPSVPSRHQKCTRTVSSWAGASRVPIRSGSLICSSRTLVYACRL